MALHPYFKTTLLTVSWFPVFFTALEHGYQPCQVSGSSMAPTFNPGTETTTNDVVLVQKYNVKKPNLLQKGDIVMFRSPTHPEKILTKRVIGVQGDLVKPRDLTYPKESTQIPRNHLWVEGDNSFHSIDSNNFGPISQALVVGKVAAIIWPLLRLSLNLPLGGRSIENLIVRS